MDHLIDEYKSDPVAVNAMQIFDELMDIESALIQKGRFDRAKSVLEAAEALLVFCRDDVREEFLSKIVFSYRLIWQYKYNEIDIED